MWSRLESDETSKDTAKYTFTFHLDKVVDAAPDARDEELERTSMSNTERDNLCFAVVLDSRGYYLDSRVLCIRPWRRLCVALVEART